MRIHIILDVFLMIKSFWEKIATSMLLRFPKGGRIGNDFHSGKSA